MDCDRKSLKLLVVNDQLGYIDQLSDHAEMNDHLYDIELKIAESMDRVYQLISYWRPSVILLDAHVFGVNCFELLQQIKDGFIPVVVTSQHNSTEIEQSALENGAALYLSTGEDPEIIENLLEQIASLAEDDGCEH
jgi:DNA-binding NtrC family response regulator